MNEFLSQEIRGLQSSQVHDSCAFYEEIFSATFADYVVYLNFRENVTMKNKKSHNNKCLLLLPSPKSSLNMYGMSGHKRFALPTSSQTQVMMVDMFPDSTEQKLFEAYWHCVHNMG